MEFTLLGAAVLGVLAMWLWQRADHQAERVPDAFGRLLSAAIVGMAGGRLVAMVLVGANPISVDFLLVRGGVSTVGASLAAVAWLVWSERRSRHHLDLLAPAGLAGLAGWHAGCLVKTSCLGAATDLPWGWAVSGSTIDRHPVELYAAGGLLLGAFVVRAVQRQGAASFVPALLSVGLAGLVRFVTEPLRLTLGELLWFYGAAAVVGLTGAALLGIRENRQLDGRKGQPEQDQEDL